MSAVGDGLVLVSMPLLAISLTHSTLLIAGTVVAGRLPALVVGLPVGAVVDRVNRRKLMVASEIGRFALLAAFGAWVATGGRSLWVLYAVAFAIGSLSVAFDCASAACLPDIIGPDRAVTANARLELIDLTGEEMVGRSIGGIVFAASRAIPFVADALSFLVSARLVSRALPDNKVSKERSNFTDDLLSGLRWFVRHPVLRLVSGMVAQLAFCQALVLGLLVIYATDDLHLSRAGYGLLLGVSAIGNLLGASLSSWLNGRFRPATCLGIAGVSAALSYPALAATHSPFAACAALIVESGAVVVGVVSSQALRQIIVPPELRGRAASVHMTVILAAFPLGGLAGGLIATAVGIRTTMVIAGVLQLAVVLVAAPRLAAAMSPSAAPDSDSEQASVAVAGFSGPNGSVEVREHLSVVVAERSALDGSGDGATLNLVSDDDRVPCAG
jgi:MFS family permease